MAQTITIALNTTAQTGGINATVRGLGQVKVVTDTLNRSFTALASRIAGIAAGVVGIHALGRGLSNAAATGVRFNATLEDARLGIAAILRQFQPQAFKTFADAMKASSDAVELLKQKAVSSPASFSQLVAGFQAISGAASGAGIKLRDQVDLVVLMSQALAGLGIRSDQLIQEARSLLTGNINQNAAVARILGITREDIELAREQGHVYEFLRDKLAAFAEAGEMGSRNFSVAVSNLGDVVEQKLGAITVPIFERIRTGVLKLSLAINETDLEGAFAGIAGKVATATGKLLDFGEGVIRHLDILKSSRLGEFIGLAIEAGIEESLNRVAVLIERSLVAAVEKIFSSDFLIWSAKAGKALAHSLLVAIKTPVDFFTASLDWLVINTGDQFTKMFAAVGRVAMDVFLGSVNVLIQALNKVPGFRGKFAQLGTEDFKGIDGMLKSLEAGADGGSFSDMFSAAGERSAAAIQTVVRYLDQQIQATEKILEQGDLQTDQIEDQISALERLKRLRDEILNPKTKPKPEDDEPLISEEKVEKARTLFQILKDEVQSFEDAFKGAFAKLQDEIQSVGAEVATTLVNGIGAAIDTVSYGLWAVIDGTATWGDLFRNVARNIISDLIRIALQEILLDGIKRGLVAAWNGFTKMMRKADAADANATEATKTPVLAANATLSSIASWGIAVAIGVAAIATILASVGAFQEGGVVAGGEQLIRVNESGREAVLNAQATSMLGENTINALNRGVMPAGGIGGDSGMTVAAAPVQGGPMNINILLVDDSRSTHAKDFLASAAGEARVVQIVQNHQTEVGISS